MSTRQRAFQMIEAAEVSEVLPMGDIPNERTALGVSDMTVRRDVGGQDLPPTPVTGLDGKTYQPRTTVEVDTVLLIQT